MISLADSASSSPIRSSGCDWMRISSPGSFTKSTKLCTYLVQVGSTNRLSDKNGCYLGQFRTSDARLVREFDGGKSTGSESFDRLPASELSFCDS